MIHIKVTEAAESHISEIVEMWKYFMDFHKDIDPFFTRNTAAHKNFEQYIRELIQSDNAHVLVAVHNGCVRAYSISHIRKYPPIYLDETYGFISDLCVNPAYQKQGIGEAMLSHMFKWFASHKVHRIELEVAAKNQIGLSFWKKHGFQKYVHIMYTTL